MKTFKVIATLLSYPEPDWLAALPELEAALVEEAALNGNARQSLASLFDTLRAGSLIDLQQEYVATFDRNPSHSLHLFEHIHGESRERGPALLDLMQEYSKHGLEISASELPDYAPLFLEFLSTLALEQARPLLADAVHVLAAVGRKLAGNGSPYAAAFQVLETLSPVEPQAPASPPVHDMDEAMEMFGPSMDGVEPLLKSGPQIAVVEMPRSRRGMPAPEDGLKRLSGRRGSVLAADSRPGNFRRQQP